MNNIAHNMGGMELFSLLSALAIAIPTILYTLKKTRGRPGAIATPEIDKALQNEYAAIENHIPIGVLTIDADGKPREYNLQAKLLIESTAGEIAQFNLFSCEKYLLPSEVTQLKNRVPMDKKVIIKAQGEKKSYLRLIVNPLDGNPSGGYQFFIIDDTQNVSQRKEMNDANALFGKALVETKIGICRLNLFDNTGFATSTWYDNLYETDATPISETFRGIRPEDLHNVESYIHEIKNIQFNEEAFLAFAEKNFHKSFSCTLQVQGKEGKEHYLKLYSEVSKYDPDSGEIIADFITINIDDHKEKEHILEETYIRTKEAEELKQSFIVNMSQEISTPLNAITLACRQLFGKSSPKEEQYALEKVEMNTSKLLGIINNIVEVSKEKTAIDNNPGIPGAAPEANPVSVPESIPFTNSNLSKEKVLLIAEDNENNFQLLRYMIKNKYKIIHAWNGEEAVQMYKDVHPDGILMDIKMPILTGYQATEIIRRQDGQIPIIAVTAYAFENDKDKILSSGFTDYLAKPINEIEMFKLLGKYL